MDISFAVSGRLPPKKDGANSMWGKGTEVENLVALRRAALAKVERGRALARNIRLDLTVHVGSDNNRRTGDLDNFVTGVCDGLMAADGKTPWQGHAVWADPRNDDVRPDRVIAIVDDSQVVEIVARKVVGSPKAPGYEIRLSGDLA